MKSFSQTYSCLYITKITLGGKSLFRRKGGGLLLLCFIFLLPINTSAESGFFQAVYQNLKSEILSGKAQGPTNPTVSVFAFQPSCTNDIPNADGYLQLSAVVDGDAYRWSEGSTFDDMGGTNAYAGAPSLTSASYPLIFATGQTNPTGSRDYTVRVYNGSDACFTDITLTMNEQDCSFGCSCTDYVYSNDLSGDLVHKFEVNSTTGAVSEVGAPWLPNGVSPLNPHGPAPDINGNLFVSEQNGTEALYIYNCDGEILNGGTPLLEGTPLGLRNNNFGSFNEYIYFGLDPGLDPTDEVVLVSSCDGTIEGRMSLPFGVNLNAWGFYVDKFSERWYIANRDNKVYSGSLNPDLYTSPASDSARYEFDLNFGSPMGITLDEQGNFYIIEDQNIGGTDNGINPGNVLLVKYDAAGNYVSDVEDASFTGNYTTDGQSGFSRTRGLVYSALSQRLYLSGRENCITVFDKNLVEEPALNIGNPSNGAAKGVALSTQCCPTSNNVKIDTVLCSGGLGTTFSLQNLINCQGSVCEGEWTPDAGNTGLIYNSCNNSITVSASNACGRFTLESDGLGTNPECGAFKIEVNISVNAFSGPLVAGDQMLCEGEDPLPFTVTSPASGGNLTYQWESSTTDCTSGFTEIPGAVSAVYDAPVLTETTYYRLITRSQNASCPLGTCADTTDCLTLSVSSIEDAGLQNIICNTNGTRTDATDDFTSFSLNPTGRTPGGTYNLSVSSGTVSPISGTYGVESTFNLQPGSPGAGDVTLTLTDANNSICLLAVLIPDPGSCAAREDYPDYEDSSNPCADLPCHTVSNDIYLGSGVTNDVAGSGGSGADTDIDDGVGLSPIFDAVPGNTINLPFTVFNNTGNDAYLRAWIDWNGDGDFDDTGEQIMDAIYSFATYSGSFTDVVNVAVPIDAVQNQDLGMRWRVSTDDANSAGPCGTGTCAADGEIEDFLLRFTCKESICLPVSIQVRN